MSGLTLPLARIAALRIVGIGDALDGGVFTISRTT